MDIKAYIESGILEAYVLGQLTPQEVNEVEAYRAKYAEVDEEIRQIEEAMEQYATAHAITPPANLKGDIWRQLEGNQPTAGTSVSPPKIVHINNRNNTYRWLAAASIVLLLASLSANIYLYHELKTSVAELDKAHQENSVLVDNMQVLKTDYNNTNNQLNTATAQLDIMRNPENRVVKMAGQAISPTSVAVVYWDTITGKTFIDPATLPVPPQGQQYQLWAIAGGKPVDAGVFDVTQDKKGLQAVKAVNAAEMFAVTLEPAGGSVSPTLANMYVAGKVL